MNNDIQSADHPMSAMPLAKYLNQISQNETPFEECSAKVQRAYLDKATFILGFLQPAFAAQRHAGREEMREMLTEAMEAMDERRCYLDIWEWKYGERWDREDSAIRKALSDLGDGRR